MLTRSKLLFAALAAATAMLALTTNASARRWSVSESEFEWLAPRFAIEAAGNNIACPVTFLGHYVERTFEKIVGLIGTLKHVQPTEEAEPPCTGGTITFLNETLPWRINYGGFTGRLPAIERIRHFFAPLGMKVRMPGGITCLFGTTILKPAAGEMLINRSTGAVEGFRFDETVGIPLGGGFICELAGESHISGTATVTNLPRTSHLTVTLI